MKKVITLVLVVMSGFCLHSQSIEFNTTSLPAAIKTDGTLLSTTGVALGYILGDGSIKNTTNVIIGNITITGVVKNSSQETVGNVSNSGNVTNAQNQLVGTVNDAGDVLNAEGKIIGKAPGISKSWAAVCFFFYKVN
jgi:hypothetical protein